MGLAQPIYRPDTLTLQKDTMKAIHHLFQARRQGAGANTGAGVGLLVGGVALVQVFSALATIPL
jgi:hypothetical protein